MIRQIRTSAVAFVMLLLIAGLAHAQEVTLFAEPLSAGVQLLAKAGEGWRFGLSATAGPLFGVDLSDANVSDVRNWATAYAAVAYRASNVQFVLNPIGAALVAGNDFSAVYPSVQGSIELVRKQLRIGTAVRVIRIAGSDGSGTYWTQWVPLRIGYVL